MKKLFFKSLIFAIVLYIILFLYLTFLPMYYNSENNTRLYYMKQVLDGKIEIKKSRILFLGDSRLNTDLDVKKIPNAWSFATGGASSIEMYYTLKNYLINFSKPDTVFISFSPQGFIEAFSFWGYAVRNNYFSCNEFSEIYKNLKRVNPDSVLGNFPYLHFLLYKLKYIEYYQDDLYKNHVFMGKRKNDQLIKHFQMENGIWNYPNLKNGSSEPNFESSLRSFEPSKLINIYFTMILDLCKTNKIKVIFDNMPVNETSYRILNQNFVSEYKAYINKFVIEYPEFTFYDTVYSYQDKYFGDASHLNSEGKEKFTKYFIQQYFKTANSYSLTY